MNLLQRYRENKTKNIPKKKLVYSSILYPMIPNKVGDIYIIPDETDRLDLLAFKYYGDVRYWWIIAQANYLGKGSMAVKPGVRLRIPADKTSILEDFIELNKRR